ncbi:MAG: type I DNA topoisomerase [Clostridiales bacterium]|nr:type I DNA topoisomerase [Bacillota bacterium]NLL54596.1 type I DNA topoisomerase [Clostridiales bacterium]
MAYKLVIVESPAKARTISKFLGKNYRVVASNGHVRDLPKSQIGVDVEKGFEPKYITIRGRGEILDKIRKEAKGATKVFLATDPDREGEAISWHLGKVLKIPEDADCRVEFHEITSREVKNAIKRSRPINMNLVDAQQARRVLDRLVGYKISPILWHKVRKGLSAGRVQSVATAIICDREREIDEFEQKEYWTLRCDFESDGINFCANYLRSGSEESEIESAQQAEAICRALENEIFSVSSVKWSERRKRPAAPFTTSNLQQEASRKLNFTTSKTMNIAQQLFEGVDIEGEGTQGLVTYIRTDSTRVSEEAINNVRSLIAHTYGLEYLPETPNVYKSRNGIQDAHEAIRPTDMARKPEAIKASLSRDQFRLYKLIYYRFVASQMTPAVYQTLSADIVGGPHTLRFSGQKMTFPGFTGVYEEILDDDQKESDTQLPDLKQGKEARLIGTDARQHFTQPPPRYTEASLVRALEEKGIGRPSTYAPTISTILARGYITREQKRMMPTELGIIVNDIMKKNFPDIVDIAFTAGMEDRLDEVEAGKADWQEVVAGFYGPFRLALEEAEKNIEKVSIEDQVSDEVCDKCGVLMVYKMGRYGKFLACPNFPECRNTKALLTYIDVPCPECGKKLLERISRKGRKFYGCEGYPDCEFVSWDLPVNEKCSLCGGRMVQKRGRKDVVFYQCVNEHCRNRIQVQSSQEEDETE